MSKISDSIIKYLANFDSAGSTPKKIDTLLEFKKLGEYLNGGYVEGNPGYSELSNDDKNTLKSLYNVLNDKFTKSVSNEQEEIVINFDNAQEYARMLGQLQHKDGEIDKLTCDKLKQALYKFLADNEYDLSGFDYNKGDYSFVIRDVKEMIKIKQEREVLAEKTLRNINKPYNNSKLRKSVKKYINENNIKPSRNTNSEVDLGNGKFDKVATQKTNVCWALASINSLLPTEKGKMLLESNRYYDEKTGVFAIHLQEAEDNGFHDGVYIITPEDIQAENGKLAEGEGDATAYLIAIKRYFEEVNQNAELAEKMESERHSARSMDDGNYGFRFFEILTGGHFSKYDYIQDSNRKLQLGIGSGGPNACGNYEYICELLNNKNGAVVLAIAEHSISVVGVRDGNLLVQESNNSEAFSKDERNHAHFNRVEDINGAPAYLLSKDDYENHIQAVSFLKW